MTLCLTAVSDRNRYATGFITETDTGGRATLVEPPLHLI